MIDTYSETWQYIDRVVRAEIDKAQRDLQSLTCDPRHADIFRGTIYAYQWLLDLPERDKKKR